MGKNKQKKVRKTKKQKKSLIVFSEKIDDAIDGYSVGLTFIAISAFFFLNEDYLHNAIATQILGAVIGVSGVIGCMLQLSKSSSIKGFDDFGIGLASFFIWLALYVKVNSFALNIFIIVFLTFGLYGMIRGAITIIYSFITTTVIPKEKKSLTAKAKDVFLFITQIFGFILTTLNILKIIGLIGA